MLRLILRKDSRASPQKCPHYRDSARKDQSNGDQPRGMAAGTDSAGTTVGTGATVWLQKRVTLRQLARGCHLVTDEVVPEIRALLSRVEVGMCHFFILHTSAVRAGCAARPWMATVRADNAGFVRARRVARGGPCGIGGDFRSCVRAGGAGIVRGGGCDGECVLSSCGI